MTSFRLTRHLAAAACLVAFVACGKQDPIANDLRALNAAGQSAMASANVQQAMAKVQTAKTNPERAAILRENAAAIAGAQAALQKVEMKSDEVRAIQTRMADGFGKASAGAATAANGFDKASTADLDKGREQIRAGQTDIIAAGTDMVKLAKERSIDLNKTP